MNGLVRFTDANEDLGPDAEWATTRLHRRYPGQVPRAAIQGLADALGLQLQPVLP